MSSLSPFGITSDSTSTVKPNRYSCGTSASGLVDEVVKSPSRSVGTYQVCQFLTKVVKNYSQDTTNPPTV